MEIFRYLNTCYRNVLCVFSKDRNQYNWKFKLKQGKKIKYYSKTQETFMKHEGDKNDNLHDTNPKSI